MAITKKEKKGMSNADKKTGKAVGNKEGKGCRVGRRRVRRTAVARLGTGGGPRTTRVEEGKSAVPVEFIPESQIFGPGVSQMTDD